MNEICTVCDNYIYTKNNETGNVIECCRKFQNPHPFHKRQECSFHEPVTSRQTPCNKVSYDCHIECDTVSHLRIKSCLSCIHFEPIEYLDGGEKLFCHHGSVKRVIESTVRNCPLQEAYDGTVSG